VKKNVLYPNLVPTYDDYPTCTAGMYRVFELAPSDSNMRAFINLLADGTYHTIIAINAVCGPFKSEGRTHSLASSLKQAQHSMLTILAHWKKGRFKDDL